MPQLLPLTTRSQLIRLKVIVVITEAMLSFLHLGAGHDAYLDPT